MVDVLSIINRVNVYHFHGVIFQPQRNKSIAITLVEN